MSCNEEMVDLQSRLAFQEHTLNELNEVVCRQQGEIDRLTRQVSVLVERFKSLQASNIATPEEDIPPPHY